jgi:hypothetical protein
MIRSRKSPDQFYIGSSSNLYHRRADHLCKNNKHLSIRNLINYNSINDLEFIILKLCEPEQLTYYEQFYISELSPPLNSHKFAGNTSHDSTLAMLTAIKDINNSNGENYKKERHKNEFYLGTLVNREKEVLEFLKL